VDFLCSALREYSLQAWTSGRTLLFAPLSITL
jgi:hypothetical protein